MTDFRALCAELVDCLEKANWPLRHKTLFEICLADARAALAQPEPQGPSEREVSEWINSLPLWHGATRDELTGIVLRAFARWGRPAIEPVPVAERLPGDVDVNKYGQVWWFDSPEDNWILDTCEDEDLEAMNRSRYTHWLPHHALPVPQQEAE